MDETVLDDQRELIDRIADAGWDVTDAEVSVYESPWADDDSAEATVTLTARKAFPDVETPGSREATDRNLDGPGDGEDDADDDNPYRVQ